MATNLKSLLEQLLSEDVDELANYPKGFDVFKLRKLRHSWEKLEYIEKYLKPLGKGSSRAVFVGDEKTALKVATSKAGQAQNKLEVQVYNKARNKSYTDIITNVFEYDENYLWIESEKAVPVRSPSEWTRVAGVEFFSFITVLDGYMDKKIKNMSLTKNVIAMMKDYKMKTAGGHDFSNVENWGIVKRGGKEQVVIIDYGLDTKVYNKYYGKNYENEDW